jgi:hypothetical protein
MPAVASALQPVLLVGPLGLFGPIDFTTPSAMIPGMRRNRISSPSVSTFGIGAFTPFSIQVRHGIRRRLAVWSLTGRAPNFGATKRLLDELYQYSADDIPHADPPIADRIGRRADDKSVKLRFVQGRSYPI